MFFLKQGKRLSNLKDFSHKIDNFVQGLDMPSTCRLSQTLIHPRKLLTLLRKVVHDATMKNSQLFLYIQNFTIIMKHTQFHSLTLRIILLSKYQSSLSTINKLQWICINYIQFTFLWTKIPMMEKKVSTQDFILNKTILLFQRKNT